MSISEPKVWRAIITFRKTVEVYVEGDSLGQARAVLDRAAEDMDVMDTGTDFDSWEIDFRHDPLLVAQPTTLEALANRDVPWADETYVWREGERRPLCDTVGDRLDELAALKEPVSEPRKP